MALTFDDGPEPANTEPLLEALEGCGISASFFLTGEKAEKNRDLVRRIRAAGHAVGCHGMSHAPLAFRTRAVLVKEVEDAVDLLEDILGEQIFLYRPAYGVRSPGLYRMLRQQGLRPVFWDVMAYDWREPPAEVLVGRVLRGARDGSIILLHDGNGPRASTIEAIPGIVKGLRDKDMRFVTLS